MSHCRRRDFSAAMVALISQRYLNFAPRRARPVSSPVTRHKRSDSSETGKVHLRRCCCISRSRRRLRAVADRYDELSGGNGEKNVGRFVTPLGDKIVRDTARVVGGTRRSSRWISRAFQEISIMRGRYSFEQSPPPSPTVNIDEHVVADLGR